MSRIGKKPDIIPANVTVDIAAGNAVTVKGPKGTLSYTFHPDMILKVDGNVLTVERPDEEHLHKSLHGLTRLDPKVSGECALPKQSHLLWTLRTVVTLLLDRGAVCGTSLNSTHEC